MALQHVSELELFINNLPILQERDWSYLETLRVSEREVIMARLLGYYFKPSEQHGLGVLFIKSLLQCYQSVSSSAESGFILQNIDELELNSIDVTLEEPTAQDNRIDILIKSNHFVVIIEFKINHILNNPLNDYIEHAKAKFPYIPSESIFCIVLTPKRQEPVGKAREDKIVAFKQIMFNDFFKRVKINKESLKDVNNENDPQLYFYNDFIATIENRRKRIDMLEKYVALAKDPAFDKNLIKLFDTMQEVQRSLNAQMEKLKSLLINYSILKSSEDKMYCVMEKKYGELKFKVRLTLGGWSLEHWKGANKVDSLKFDFETRIDEIKHEVLLFEQTILNVEQAQ
ncbi:PD-(D/E)XK nuclease family protein [Rufibacter immobilis]|uniref:PD-(D/E)XK nuclease family protein n=1 Tax=Rufibacter immobilis TaxID=1348778 RepID=UPI0035EE3D09